MSGSPTDGDGGGGATPPTGGQVYARLLGQVRPHWRVFAGALVAMVVLAATEPAIPALLKPTLDGSFVEKDLGAVGLMAGALVAVFLVRGLSSFSSAAAMSWISSRLVMELRRQMFDKLTTLPTRYHDHTSSGHLISKITFDAARVTEASTVVLTVLVRDSLAIAGLLGWMLYLQWKLTLIALLTAPFVLLVIRYFARRLRGTSQALQESMGEVTHVVEETTAGHQIVRTFGAEAYERGRFRAAVDRVRRLQYKFSVAAAANAPLAQFITALGLAAILYVAGHESAQGRISVGSFVSFFMAMAMLFAPLKRLTGVNALLQQGIAAAASVFALVDEPSERDRGTRDPGRVGGRIEFRAVTFGYDREHPPVLRGIDLEVEPGETVALVGPSGGGKSTLVGLIPRFYDVEHGSLLIDGIDVNEFSLRALRANIALVSQDIVLFNDTVAANIAYGRDDANERERVREAARAAHALEFVEALPEGMDTYIGERGVRLSGGQRQRLALARAFFKDAPILILDEATSALDSASERHVQAAIETLRRGRTTLIVAHRLSSIERADRILVINEGAIVESGTHRALVERSAFYASLYRLQFDHPARSPAEAG